MIYSRQYKIFEDCLPEKARLKYSEEAEVYEETKKMRAVMKMMIGNRWTDNLKSDAKEMNGAGS